MSAKPCVYGLIGYPLSHSFSPAYFAQKFEREGIEDALYRAFPLERIELFAELEHNQPHLRGLNVTLPYKQAIIPWLSELSLEAEAVGAVNTLEYLGPGCWRGHNTDVLGFRLAFLRLLGKRDLLPRALIIGSGGASLAVQYVLKDLGWAYQVLSRQPQGPEQLSYEALSAEDLASYSALIQTTPLGMYPTLEACPPLPYSGLHAEQVAMDLIYNPPLTRFLSLAQAAGLAIENGQYMLEQQAEAAWRIWRGSGG